MWKSAYVGVYQLLNWKMHGGTLKIVVTDLVWHEKQNVGYLKDCHNESVLKRYPIITPTQKAPNVARNTPVTTRQIYNL